MEKLKVTHRAELRKRHETAESNSVVLDDTVERTAVLAATPAKSLYNSTVDVHLYIDLPQNLIIDVIIEHSSTPECWRTVPNELKPSHQAWVIIFAPPPLRPLRFVIRAWGRG